MTEIEQKGKNTVDEIWKQIQKHKMKNKGEDFLSCVLLDHKTWMDVRSYVNKSNYTVTSELYGSTIFGLRIFVPEKHSKDDEKNPIIKVA